MSRDDRSVGPDETISEPFGIYRAEWLNNAVFRLFTKPAYYPELETHRPCVLVGGRGTGKTTVLRCLSYEGRFELEGSRLDAVSEWPYYGFYHRVNTNRVTAFRGDELSEQQWIRAFAHYLNLLMCGQVLNFLNWYSEKIPGSRAIDRAACEDLAESLFVARASDQRQMSIEVDRGRRRFEAFLNNIDPESLPPFSLQGQPVDDLCREVLKLPQFSGKHLCFIVDEFENYLDYQQQVLNTLIKHCGTSYTFKIGVKELGWRKRSTLNLAEQLVSPADYERIDIAQRLSGDQFEAFAAEVCALRVQAAPNWLGPDNIQVLLPALTIEQEADFLGARDLAAQIKRQMRIDAPEWVDEVDSMRPLEICFVDFWARSKVVSLAQVMEERRSSPKAWSERFDNYAYPMLFTFRKGRVGIRKYYAGWRTFVLLAGGNIRYLLELVGQAFILQRQMGRGLEEPVAPEVQTRAAQNVGRKNLAELEGLSVHGAQLTKLLLGLGRVFEILSLEPEGHAPEVTQFYLPEDAPLGGAEALLSAAVMHLALIRSVSNKRVDLDLQGFDYAVHPIFAAFFTFSHRRKRKMKVTPTQLLSIVEEPRRAIRQILRQHNRISEYPLPEQLRLFGGFYGSN